MRNSKNIIIGALLIVILAMAVGYSAFATDLKLTGTAEIIGEWNVRITNVIAQDVCDGCEASDISFTDTSATFNAKLKKPGDYITYLITFENAGTIDAILKDITFTPEEDGSSAIIYEKRDPIELLKAGDQAAFLLKVTYDENTTEVPETKTRTITVTIQYAQK